MQEQGGHGTPVRRVGDPLSGLIIAGNEGLKDPKFRARLREMHENKLPLVAIVENLGLAGDLSVQVRQVLENLSRPVVDDIRQAMLDMLDRQEQTMPLDCAVTVAELEAGSGVQVEVVTEANKRIVRARPAAEA